MRYQIPNISPQQVSVVMAMTQSGHPPAIDGSHDNYPFHWLHPRVEQRATGTHGDGLYAARKFKAGECLLIFGGHVLTVAQEARLPGRLGDNGMQIAKNLVLCATSPEQWGGGNYLNHSCEPNAGFRGQIAVVAMRDIRSGEQITIDYAMVLYHPPRGPDYSLGCLCGTPSCRGRVTDNDWKIAALQERYRGFFQPYLQDEIERLAARKPPRETTRNTLGASGA